MAYDCSVEEAELQKKLIPVNIVVCVLCLVAIISLLFTPFIKLDLNSLDKGALTEMLGSVEGSTDGEGESGSSGGVDFEAMLDGIGGEFSVTPLDVAKFAFSDESIVQPIMQTAFEAFLVPTVNKMMMEELKIDTTDLDLTALNEKFQAFNNVKSEEEMREVTNDWLDEIAKLAGVTVDPADKEEATKMMVDMYNETVEVAGDFNIEKFICVIASESAELDEPVTNYMDLIDAMIAKEGENGEMTGIAEAMDVLYALEEMVKMAAKGIFGLFVFTSAVWFVLFLFSLLHIFAQNKRFMMWYVKLWGFIPCLLFGVLPMILTGAVNTIGGEMAVLGAILSCFSSMTWISGACYLILWLVSIFWAFPIKHKIRADRKN